VSYLKRLLQEKGLGLGRTESKSFIFMTSAARSWDGDGIRQPEPGYYETIVQLTREALDKNYPEEACMTPSWWMKARISPTICSRSC